MEQEANKKKPGKKLLIAGIAIVVILAAGLIYFFSGANYESTDNAQLDGDIVAIRSGVTGYIKNFRFADNQPVKKGDTLVVFDSDELRAKVLQAEAALDNATANLQMVQNKAVASGENATASQLSAESNEQGVLFAKTKLDKAQKDLDRVNDLYKIKGATQEQVDNAQANLQMAKSEYNKSIDQQQSSISTSHGVRAQAKADQNQIDLAKAQIKQREAELALAQKQLSYAYVVAPCSGIVTKRSFNQGQYLTIGQSLCVIVNTENYWVTANFKETQLKKIKLGDEVEIELDSYPGLKLTGKVESFGGATGAKFSLLPPDNATGNFIKITQRFPARISIDNFPKEKSNEIFPGLSVFAKVKVG
jgi:membrane fusion protein (multidrug efflux system)